MLRREFRDFHQSLPWFLLLLPWCFFMFIVPTDGWKTLNWRPFGQWIDAEIKWHGWTLTLTRRTPAAGPSSSPTAAAWEATRECWRLLCCHNAAATKKMTLGIGERILLLIGWCYELTGRNTANQAETVVGTCSCIDNNGSWGYFVGNYSNAAVKTSTGYGPEDLAHCRATSSSSSS